MKKLKVDPKKVEYDGRTFRLIIQDEAQLLKKLKEKQAEIIKDLDEKDQSRGPCMDLRIRMLLRNALVSKSGTTMADTEVLKEIALRLGYALETLKQLDIGDPKINPNAWRRS